MLPQFLLPETIVRLAGQSPDMDLGELVSGTLIVTLGITRIVEQESLDVSIWGSADGAEWAVKPLVSFPQKFYCGTYQILLNFGDTPARFLRAKWQVNRWGKGETKPLFGVYLFVQAMELAVHA